MTPGSGISFRACALEARASFSVISQASRFLTQESLSSLGKLFAEILPVSKSSAQLPHQHTCTFRPPFSSQKGGFLSPV